MQLRYVFSELRQGLRRNLSMHLAVILTLSVSLTLVGLGVLLQKQVQRAEAYWGSQLQITFYLCRDQDPNPRCNHAVTDAEKQAILKVVQGSPDVSEFHLESSQEAYDKVKLLYDKKLFEGPNPPVTATSMPQSVWVTLKNPENYQNVSSALIGLDGVASVRDMRQIIDPIYTGLNVLKSGSFVVAGLLLLAALLLVANTIRLAALARRKEIAIMRLVGASSVYIGLPFMLEALLNAALGILIAGGLLAGLMQLMSNLLQHSFRFIPWIGQPEYYYALAVIAIAAPLLTVLPTLVLARKYTKV